MLGWRKVARWGLCLAVVLFCTCCGNSNLPLTPAADGGDVYGGWGDQGGLDITPFKGDSVAIDTAQGADVATVQDAGPTDSGDPVDAGSQTTCGDGACEAPETAGTCPGDCGPPPNPCGDGQCNGAETLTSCAIDCKPEAKAIWQCLQGKCGALVKTCHASPACQAGVNSSMNCFAGCNFQSPCNNLSTCVAVFAANPAGEALAKCGLTECYQGAGTAICGDGKCGTGETPSNCPSDCAVKPVCGDGKCNPPETSSSCPADCAAPAKCGDEICSGSESAGACPIDCNSGAKAAWNCLQQKCGSQKAACQSDSGCISALNEVGICVCQCGSDSKCEEACVLKHLSNSKLVGLGSCGVNNCPATGC